MNTNRPLTATIAIVLLMLMSVTSLIAPLLPLSSKPPLFITVWGVIVIGVGGLLAVVGLWKLKRWGLVLTSSIAALTILVAMYSLWITPIEGKVASGILAVLSALLLVLVALPATRRAYAAARAPVAPV